jgi:hypothetical protein
LTRCVKIDKLVFQLLQHAVEASTTATLLLGVPEQMRSKLFQYLKALENKNVISFRLDGQMLKSFEAAAEEEHRRAAAGEMTPQLRITRKTTVVQSTLVTIQSAKS